MKLIDLTGQTFGRLTVISQGPTRESRLGGSNWLCRCSCGIETMAVGSSLRNGRRKSCGCLGAEWAQIMGSNPEFISKRAATITIHGQKRRGRTSLEYKTWLGIKGRCSRKSHIDYPAYGAKGIMVLEPWASSFESFFFDMGPRPTPVHTIDRIDPAGHYGPGNCRWATALEQATEHHRGLVPVTVLDENFPTVTAACQHFGLRYTTIMNRLATGVSPDEAFSKSRMKARRTQESYIAKDRR